MSAAPPVSDDERQYKEVLYLLMEKVRATKAAFYLVEPSGSFRLAAQYGFSRGDRLANVVTRNDALANAVYEHREPHFINDPRQAGKLAELMAGSSTTRILTAPLYLDGRIIGILDIRDKGGREPFVSEDVHWVNEVLRRLAMRVRANPRFAAPGDADEESPFEFTSNPDKLRPVQQLRTSTFQVPASAAGGSAASPGPAAGALGRAPSQVLGAPPRKVDPAVAGADGEFEPLILTGPMALHSMTGAFSAPSVMPQDPMILTRGGASGPPPVPEVELSTKHLPSVVARTQRFVDDSLAQAGKRVAAIPLGPSSRESGFYAPILETCLLLPGVAAAALSTFEPRGIEINLASRSASDEIEAPLLENLAKVFARAGASFGFSGVRTFHPIVLPGREPAPRLTSDDVAAIQSSVIAVSPQWVAILSIVFRPGLQPGEREDTKPIHLLVKNVLSEIRGGARLRDTYRGLVNKLLEPGLKKYAGLRTHSFNVARLARKLAEECGLSVTETEQITVAAVLHDVGMRDLAYDELYAKRSLSEDELRLVKEHPRAGAFLLEDVAFPYPIAPLVRHHHERWDGNGYPAGLRGETIPFGARLIHLCESWDAMTSPTTYRSVLTTSQAAEILIEKRGTQFDPELAPLFVRIVGELNDEET